MAITHKADKHYLRDITGKLPEISLDDLVKKEGLSALLPDTVRDYLETILKAEDKSIHSYGCQIDKAENTAQKVKCKSGEYLSSEDSKLAERRSERSYGFIQFSNGYPTVLFGDLKGQVSLPPSRTKGNRGLKNTILNQGKIIPKKKTFYVNKVVDGREKQRESNNSNFNDAVNGEDGKSIGQRAILFDEYGRPIKGANAIRDRDEAIQISSRQPTNRLNDGSIPSKIAPGKTLLTSKQSANKHGIGQTSDALGGIAALGGITAVVAAVACLVPLHFVTTAITFLTSITTMITNVNNAAGAVFTIADGVFALFNKKNATKPLKTLMANAIDNAFGKTNVQEAKSRFASLVNSIAVTSKLLEKIQQGRSSTNGKIDEVAFSLGVLNNSAKDSGMIPADSPYMAQSQSIDEFVKNRAKTEGNEGLEESITTLTKELKTHEEVNRTIKEEKIVSDKIKAKQDKDINDVMKLVDSTKTNVDAVKAENL